MHKNKDRLSWFLQHESYHLPSSDHTYPRAILCLDHLAPLLVRPSRATSSSNQAYARSPSRARPERCPRARPSDNRLELTSSAISIRAFYLKSDQKEKKESRLIGSFNPRLGWRCSCPLFMPFQSSSSLPLATNSSQPCNHDDDVRAIT